MCGIIGELSPTAVDVERFKRMRDELSHRGPDGAGLYTNEDGTVALGHRRLSIIDLSNAGDQPMSNEDGTVWLVFNGEIYNHEELRSELNHHEFTSETDSEVIVHGYEEWGVDCVKKLRGMFAFGIWDETEERLFLARDRLGIKPLQYYEDGDRLVFASELKAIVEDERVDRRVDPVGLKHYLRYRYIPAPFTIWEGISKLPAGCYLTYDGEQSHVERYWEASAHATDEETTVESATHKLNVELNDAVSSHLVSDVPVGVLLSGGVDSSVVTALAADSAEGLSAFSMGFEPEEHSELEYSRLMAEEFDLEYHEETLSPEKLETLLDDILYYYDEPLADSSIFPTFLLMQQASEHLKVVLSGDGGDELFGGYQWYDTYRRFRNFNPLSSVFSAHHTLTAAASACVDSSLLRSLEWRLELAGLTGVEQYQMAMHPPIRDSWVKSLLSDEFLPDGQSVDVVKEHATEQLDIKDAQLLDLETFMRDDILTKVDRASMANSLEVRVPLLDHNLVEFALSLPSDVVYNDGEKKHLLKKLARRKVPRKLIERKKQGFGAPLDEMGFLDQYESVLVDSQAAADGIFDQVSLREYLNSDPPTHNLFKLVLFELWYRRWAT